MTGLRQRRRNLVHWQRFTDDTGGKRQDFIRPALSQLGNRPTACRGGSKPLLTGAGIGIAGIDQQVTRIRLRLVLTRDQYRRGAEGIAGIHGGAAGPFIDFK